MVPRLPTPTLRTAREIRPSNDAALGIEGFELVTALFALECCFAFEM